MARWKEANWYGSPNETPGGMDSVPLGLVLHIEEGTERGTESWFANRSSKCSSHFGVWKDGRVDQFVDTRDKAWAEVAGNAHWISVEHEGHHGDSLTPAQLEADARLFAWLRQQYGEGAFPLRSTDDVHTPGLGWHGMGGEAWGGHLDCPGEPIKSQRQDILDRVSELLADST
jgi:hypothetical protein